ncbi:putative 4-hydroxy-2-oxoglutarate aldolase [Fusarium oxysporum f. sp. albedinis]|nr:putative 4-hydroxy-2-oxoglutarate aldolase [Fusarium oxysporum f. sp. albedinis]
MHGLGLGDQRALHSIIKFMPLRKFELITRYFRTFDYTKLDVRDQGDLPKTFQAAEEWSNHIQRVSIELYLPGTNLTVDECIIPFTGRSKETTLVKGKPTPVGFKVWVIAQQGYFLQWLWHVKALPYTAVIVDLPTPKPVGKKGKLRTEIPLSNTQSVVVHLVKRLLTQTYHVFTDNLFLSPQLFRLLRQLGFGATGTARPNCGISTEMKRIKETGKAPNGTPLRYNEVILIPTQDKKVIQIAWKDSGVVLFISTVHSGPPHERTPKKRKLPAKRGTKIEAQQLQRIFNGDSFKIISIPIVAAQYNDEMNHVDREDQIRSYTTYEHRFRRGPWQALLWNFLLEVALANSFILQKKTRHPRWKHYPLSCVEPPARSQSTGNLSSYKSLHHTAHVPNLLRGSTHVPPRRWWACGAWYGREVQHNSRDSTLRAWKECIYNAIFNRYAAEGSTRKRNRSGKEEDTEDPESRQKHLERDINHVYRGSISACLACVGGMYRSQQGYFQPHSRLYKEYVVSERKVQVLNTVYLTSTVQSMTPLPPPYEQGYRLPVASFEPDMASATGIPLAKHWAVLVGINFYGGAEDLKGCVQDVWAMKQYLQTGQHSVDVAALTATAPANSTSRRPTEDPDCWPTWVNLTNKLKRVLNNAKPGDFVYFHFSGHGTRLPESAKSAHASGNLALALFEESGPGMRYFQGQLLANCLRRMVEKGLLVTVVLDCCFSGSVLRDGNIRGTDVRAVDYNPDVDAGIPSGSSSDFFQPDQLFRDAAVFPDQWLVAPDGYTILAACGPHEIARELQLAQGERRGALTYFLLDVLDDLRKRCTEITHESLYEHLRVRFRTSWPQQTPMRYGNKDMSFFGHLGARSDMAYVRIYYRAEDQRLCLDAGLAHGVHPNDEYAVYPLGSEDATSRSDILVTVRVENVGPLTSEVATTGQERAIQGHVDCWIAKPLTTFPRRKISVRLAASAHKFHSHIQQTRDSDGQRWLRLCTNDEQEACMFNLAVNDRQEYEILDGTLQRIRSLPTVPIGTPDAEYHVSGMLQHLAEFKYIEGIENQLPNSSFEASFSLLSSADGNVPDTSAVHDVEHGGIWRLALENHSDSPLYIAIFNFTPSWKILLSTAGDNAFRVMQPRGMEELRMEMKVPEWLQRLGGRHCEDVIKVFVTAKPTSFPSLILPEIALHAQHRGGVHGRGDALSALLANLATPLRGPNYLGQEAWATRSFIIRTAMHGND